MKKSDWSIKAIKHMKDDTWDAMLISRDSSRSYQRVFSSDGFHWTNRYHKTIELALQVELTKTVGDMVESGISYVVV